MSEDTVASLQAKIALLEATYQGTPEYRLLALTDKWTERGSAIVGDMARLTSLTPEAVLTEVTADPDIAAALLSRQE